MGFLVGALCILLGAGAIALAWQDKVGDAWHVVSR